MNTINAHSRTLLIGVLFALMCGTATADDTELFVYDSSQLAIRPNILLIFDTSGSMNTTVDTQPTYDPNTTYTGSCAAGRTYWQKTQGGSNNPPRCNGRWSSNQWFNTASLQCKAANDAIARFNSGKYEGQVAQYDPTNGGKYSSGKRWVSLNVSNDASWTAECADDSGKYGNGTDTTKTYAQNGDAANPWTSDSSHEISWSGINRVTLYDSNYLNWANGPASEQKTRNEVMKDVATNLLASINGVNMGLMRYNPNVAYNYSDSGGRLTHAIEDIATSRTTLTDAVNALPANGNTPLAETLYEAERYFAGKAPQYGVSTAGAPGIADGVYQTPILHSCQKNYIVYLTDGEPTRDSKADSLITALPDFASITGNATCDGSGTGHCLDDLADYMHHADLLPNMNGKQSVTTYTVGFTANFPLLESTAQRGGGQYYTANDTATLSQALTNIVTSILNTQATFTAPTVSVNTFNRTRHLNDLYVTVFQPSSNAHWPGNLKKYHLRPSDDTIIDANGNAAVNAGTGFFMDESKSYWSGVTDGSNVQLGGAAHQIPAPADRKVYTYLGTSNDLTDTSNDVVEGNTALVTDLTTAGGPAATQIIDYMRGIDVEDSNQNNSNTDARDQLGDSLHSQPAAMIYGGTIANPDPNDAVVYFATNDGYLHAIDPSTGDEKWAFIPPEFLQDQAYLMQNPTAENKHYGIDGSLRLQVVANNDGVIDSSDGERVYLFFGMRRGGNFYYGLDVTDPDHPKLLWKLDSSDLPGIGQTWSNPVPTKIKVSGVTENDKDLVLVFGGGYDTTEDNTTNTADDTVGNDIYIVDSVTGALLWHGGSQTGATKTFAKMKYAFPSDIKVIDLDGDGYADRMYAADMGGQIWRFDITNNSSATDLVNGGVIAQFGRAGMTTPTTADNRRFYYSPDVALVNHNGKSWMHIGIGSGYRSHPNSTDIQDRFYSLRDYSPFQQLTQTQFNNRTIVKESDLTDVTSTLKPTMAANSPGWMIKLASGEKVLAEARTFNNDIYFTTFTPGAAPNADNCVPRLGTNKLYIVSMFDGSPVTNLDTTVSSDPNADPDALTLTDRSKELNGSISSEVVFLFPSSENNTCTGSACSPPPVACVDLFCMPTGFKNHPVRTTWTEDRLDR